MLHEQPTALQKHPMGKDREQACYIGVQGIGCMARLEAKERTGTLGAMFQVALMRACAVGEGRNEGEAFVCHFGVAGPCASRFML